MPHGIISPEKINIRIDQQNFTEKSHLISKFWDDGTRRMWQFASKVHGGDYTWCYSYYRLEANHVSFEEHVGTHLDAPAHTARGKWRIDDIPLENLICPAVVIDVTVQVLHSHKVITGWYEKEQKNVAWLSGRLLILYVSMSHFNYMVFITVVATHI